MVCKDELVTPVSNLNTVLAIDDNAANLSIIYEVLTEYGLKVLTARSGVDALKRAASRQPQLILLDVMLPGTDGFEICRQLKANPATQTIPVIFMTALSSLEDKVRGFQAGAVDYVTKPFSPRELVARIKAVLRRVKTSDGHVTSAGMIELDSAAHRVSANGSAIQLGPTEYRLLKFLMTHANRVYSRSQLLDNVWGANVYVEERTVDVHVRRLRKALTPHACEEYIQTVRGAGYRFSVEGA